MKYLLDTHTLIWTLFDTPKLSDTAKDIIRDPANDIFVSAINFWEISIKVGSGKLGLGAVTPESLPETCLDHGFEFINLDVQEASSFYRLAVAYHKDPFDRMLIWQAINRNHILLTNDENIAKYTSEGLKVVW